MPNHYYLLAKTTEANLSPADIRAGCRHGGKAQSGALEYVSRSAQGLGARAGRGSGPAMVRVDTAGIGESDRWGQCGSGQRGGEAFPPTPGNRSAAAGAGRRGRILFVECSKLTPFPRAGLDCVPALDTAD